jgi:hypothetical protein
VTRDADRPTPDEPEELAPLDPAVEAELFEALRAAWAPAPLDPARHRRILEAALEDPFAEPSEEEIRQSERLRRALEHDDGSHPDVELARALRSAVRPAERPASVAVPESPRAAGRVIYATFGAVALAAAAAFALFVASPQREAATSAASVQATPTQALHASRTTDELFSERFKTGGATERIDRIALAREHDLRENRYRWWGVR